MTRSASRVIQSRHPLRQVRKLADRVLPEIMDAIRQRPLAARRPHHAAEQVLRARHALGDLTEQRALAFEAQCATSQEQLRSRLAALPLTSGAELE